MKDLKISIAVLLCSVVFFASCEKENVKPTTSAEQEALKDKSSLNKNKDGGGDEGDWIIIYGVVNSEASSDPIENAEVILFDKNFVAPIDTSYTNSLGEFDFENDSADYAFRISAVGFQVMLSNSYTFPDSNPVIFNLREE